MNAVKQIPRPVLTAAHKLTPLQLNSLKLSKKHTVLTPEAIEELKRKASKPE